MKMKFKRIFMVISFLDLFSIRWEVCRLCMVLGFIGIRIRQFRAFYLSLKRGFYTIFIQLVDKILI